MTIFQDLPPELSRQCLLRVPYTSHNNLAAVCRSWEAVVKSPQFYEDRKKLGISQHCICLIEVTKYRYNGGNSFQELVITVHDTVQGTWEELPRLPRFPGYDQTIPRYCHCFCVNRKLVLITGMNPDEMLTIQPVFIYDFSTAQWSRGTNSPLEAVHCASSVSPEGLIYVAGGMDLNENAVRGAAVYNVEKDEWKLLPLMNQQQWGHCFGAFIDGKFFVIDRRSCPRFTGFKPDPEVYDAEVLSVLTFEI